MARQKLIVVALGGNAISRPDEEGNVEQQFANSRHTARALADLMELGNQIVVTHGNGPQIGNFLLRNRAAADKIYPLPMEVAVAHVQGGMGFMIATTLRNELASRGRSVQVAAVITTVLVDRDDQSFADPAKPIGRVLTEAEAQRFAVDQKWRITEVSPGKFRRLIASPMPRQIMEMDLLRRIVRDGDILVACGGGGIPVVDDAEVGLRGIPAVIDKDFTSAMLASELGADAMMILTNVERVSINFAQPGERSIDRMTLDEARAWLAEGQFPAGSMGPKVQGAINFLAASSNDDAHVIIGPLDKAAEAVAGTIGTRITKS